LVTEVTDRLINDRAAVETQVAWNKSVTNQLGVAVTPGLGEEVRMNLANLTDKFLPRHRPEVVVPDPLELDEVTEDLASLAAHQNVTAEYIERASVLSDNPSFFLTPVGVGTLMAIVAIGTLLKNLLKQN